MKRRVWKSLRKSNAYFVALEIGPGEYDVSYSAQLVDIMSLVSDLLVATDGSNRIFIDHNQAGEA